ncbi:3'-5' exonuclease [Sulfurimonas sp.]|uniref:3'-5' exonuclease n=1 Tax=Sulfurimonas sp. TaxID=2022749 RepID=UPI002AB0075A|nr:3'-5' exonuclease [Sulfurimonas sp.]
MFAKIKQHFNRKNLTNEDYSFLFDEAPEDEYVVYDTETTGLNPKVDEILSIGALKIRGDKIITSEKFELFVQPTNLISEESIKIHQIRNIDLQNGSKPDEALDKFLHFVGSRPLIGYYLEFDVAMINKYLKPYLGITLPQKQIEVSSMYYDLKTKFIPNANIDLRFDTIMKDLGLPIFGKHDATNDAIMTAMIYLKLKNIDRI